MRSRTDHHPQEAAPSFVGDFELLQLCDEWQALEAAGRREAVGPGRTHAPQLTGEGIAIRQEALLARIMLIEPHGAAGRLARDRLLFGDFDDDGGESMPGWADLSGDDLVWGA